MKQVARPGDDLRKHITASFLNKLKKSPKDHTKETRTTPSNPICVTGRTTGSSINRFEAVNIIGPWSVSTNEEAMTAHINVEVNDILETGKWGIAQSFLSSAYSSKIVIAGLTWALFTYTEGDTHVDVENGVLRSSVTGRAEIIFPPQEEGKPGLILIGSSGGGSAKLFVTPAEGIPAMLSNDGAYTYGKAQCFRIINTEGSGNVVTGEISDEVTWIYNSVSGSVPGGVVIQAQPIDGSLFVDVVDCQATVDLIEDVDNPLLEEYPFDEGLTI
jgi:hypothetical protein